MRIISFILISLTFLSTVLLGNTVTYNGSNTIVSNPEKGLYQHSETRTSNYTPLSLSFVQDQRNTNNITQIFRLFILDNFVNGPINAATLNLIEQDLVTIRNGGAKAIIRFGYTTTFTGSPPYGDANKATILQHISQLAPILQAHSDVIATIQAGFIGIWGEWYYTDHFQTASTTQGAIDRREVLEALLNVFPTSRMVSHRYPEGKAQMYGLSVPGGAISLNDAYDGSNLSRIAFHNGCFLVAANHYTYDDNINGRAYVALESEFYVMGGESCGTSSFTNCPNSLSDLATYHWSYLNEYYHPNVMLQWQNEGCYNEVVRRLGYRFRLINATITPSVSGNQNIDVNIEMTNDGWARPYNPRNVEVVFRNQSDQSEYTFSMVPQGQDARLWLPEQGATKTLSTVVPASGLPGGDYDVFLNLADPEPGLYNNPNYSIRTANTGLWEATTGYNDLQSVVTVNSSSDNVLLYAWLEGALFNSNNQYNTLMRSDLYDAGLLPGQTPISGSPTPPGQPYDIAPWNYNGTEGNNWTDADYQNVVTITGQKPVDWILVSFRTAPGKATEVSKTAALLLVDGTVFFPDPLSLNTQSAVHVLVEHRSHIAVLSASALSPVGGVLSVDFRTENGYLNGGFSQKEITAGRWALYGGDGDQATDSPGYEVTAKDRILWSQKNGLFSLYDPSDFTMDKDISGFDRVFWSLNNGIFSNIER